MLPIQLGAKTLGTKGFPGLQLGSRARRSTPFVTDPRRLAAKYLRLSFRTSFRFQILKINGNQSNNLEIQRIHDKIDELS